MTAVFSRELRAFFTTPAGYAFTAAFLLVANLLFVFFNLALSSSDLSPLFYSMAVLLMFLTPVLSARLIASEFGSGTGKLLLCAPVRPLSVIAGKFLAGLAVCAGALALTLIDVAVIATFGAPDGVLAAGSYMGLLAISALFLSLGILVSSLCKSRTAASVASLCVFGALFVLDWAADFIPWERAAVIMRWLSPLRRFANMTRGVFYLSDIVFFLSAAGVCLFLASRSLEKKRWS